MICGRESQLSRSLVIYGNFYCKRRKLTALLLKYDGKCYSSKVPWKKQNYFQIANVEKVERKQGRKHLIEFDWKSNSSCLSGFLNLNLNDVNTIV